MPGARPPLLTLRVLLWRGRHGLTLLACAALVLAVARTLAPPPPPTTTVVVTSRDVPPGQRLEGGDLRTAAWPRHLVPDGALQVAEVVGREPLVALPQGVPLVAGLVAGDRYDVAVPTGAVVVPVRLADPAVSGLLRPGDRVDLVQPAEDAEDGPPVVVARAALVLRADAGGRTTGPLGLDGTQPPAITVVAVGPAEGRALAAAGTWGGLGAVLLDG